MSYEKVTEGVHPAEFILSEANGYRSREMVELAEGEDLEAGTVLGQVTASGEYVQWNPDADPEDGSETAVAILYGHAHNPDSEQRVAIVARDAEVDGAKLIWPEGADVEAGIADLAEQNIRVR